jgi:hypothetical protein
MKRAYKLLIVGFALVLVGFVLQVARLYMSRNARKHAAERGQARLRRRVGRTYWMTPATNSTYQFVRFGDRNTAESIAYGSAVKDTETFVEIQLSGRPDSDDGAYQVRFANGALK